MQYLINLIMKLKPFRGSGANKIDSDCEDNFSMFLEAVSTGEYQPPAEPSIHKLKSGSRQSDARESRDFDAWVSDEVLMIAEYSKPRN